MRSGPSLGTVYKTGALWFLIPQSFTFLRMAACSFFHFKTRVARGARRGPAPRCTGCPPPAPGRHHLHPSCKQPGSLPAPALGRPESCFPEAQFPPDSAAVLAPSPARGARSAWTSSAFHPHRELRGETGSEQQSWWGNKQSTKPQTFQKKPKTHHKTTAHVSCLRPPPPGCPPGPPAVTGTREATSLWQHQSGYKPAPRRLSLLCHSCSLLPQLLCSPLSLTLPLLQKWGGRMTDAIFYKMR